jgi:4-hydroxybenzoate polyprenyltransferase/phosphoglycolate phosphatase-like HAD superfamily hydrolase
MKDGLLPVLVVDLDGTLLRSDILYESFWSAFGRDWRSPFTSLVVLLSGRAALKKHLATTARLDATTLPYDQTVIAYVEAWRLQGGRTALVTASDQKVADQVAEHLRLFDEVHGSDGKLNLKGTAKADFLADRYRTEGYAYIGDATADLPVWQGARKAITVNAPQSLKNRTEQLQTEIEHLTTKGSSIGPHLMALRPHQWLKNTLIFLPMFVAHQLDWATVVLSMMAFIAFSLIASSVYVLNDLLDLASDRAHPRKRLRPFASGSVPISHGSWMAAGLLVLGASMAALLGWRFALIMAAYYLLTSAYSLSLKRLVVIDICVLAGLYTLRILAGGVASDVKISMWLLAFSIFFFLSLAAVKRQAELVDSTERGKLSATGRGYQVADLPIISMIALCSGYVSVLVMALYVNSPTVRELYAQPRALGGICGILLYWVTYIVMITHRGSMHDDPVVYAAKDRTSQVCAGLIVIFAIAGAVL